FLLVRRIRILHGGRWNNLVPRPDMLDGPSRSFRPLGGGRRLVGRLRQVAGRRHHERRPLRIVDFRVGIRCAANPDRSHQPVPNTIAIAAGGLSAGGGDIASEDKAERGGGKSVQRGACTQPMAAFAAVTSILWHTLSRKCRYGTPQKNIPFIRDRGAFAATPPGRNRKGGRLPQQQSLHRQG